MSKTICFQFAAKMLLTFTLVIGSGCASQKSCKTIESFVENHAIRLKTPSDLDILIKKAAGKRLVLLGEATHGTREFYEWRSEISKRLIEEAGFNFIVVEGDWQPFCQVNRFVKGITEKEESAETLLRKNFTRWPPWMWANPVIENLVTWIRKYNEGKPQEKRAGFYGMDVYGQWESMKAVKEYIKNSGSEKLLELKSNYNCFADYNYDEWAYARAVLTGSEPCNKQVEEVVNLLREKEPLLSPKSRYDYFSAKQNAIVMQNAELYYRTAGIRGPDGWNNRVLHMKDTVKRLLDFYGEDAKGIIWAHNTHIGDARATSMAAQGQINIGQLAREYYGKDNVYIVGFGTHRGTVRAGRGWGLPGEVMVVPPGKEESAEDLFNRASHPVFFIHISETEIEELKKAVLHRAIGVVYNPLREAGNYVPTVLPMRYDSFIFIDETTAIHPL